MNVNQFTDELDKIVQETNDKITALVHKAQEENGLNWDTTESLPFYDEPNWQNKADNLAQIAGWIYDRVNGINRLHKKSMTKKIRKALGYTIP